MLQIKADLRANTVKYCVRIYAEIVICYLEALDNIAWTKELLFQKDLLTVMTLKPNQYLFY